MKEEEEVSEFVVSAYASNFFRTILQIESQLEALKMLRTVAMKNFPKLPEKDLAHMRDIDRIGFQRLSPAIESMLKEKPFPKASGSLPSP